MSTKMPASNGNFADAFYKNNFSFFCHKFYNAYYKQYLPVQIQKRKYLPLNRSFFPSINLPTRVHSVTFLL